MQFCVQRQREDRDDVYLRMAQREANDAAEGGFQVLKNALVEALLAKGHAERNVGRLCRELERGINVYKNELRREVIEEYQNAGVDDPVGTFKHLEARRAQLHHDRQEFEHHRQELIEQKRKFRKEVEDAERRSGKRVKREEHKQDGE